MLNARSKQKTNRGGGVGRRQVSPRPLPHRFLFHPRFSLVRTGGFFYFPNHKRTNTLKTKKKTKQKTARYEDQVKFSRKIFLLKSPCAVHVAFCGIFQVQVYSSFCSSVDSSLSVQQLVYLNNISKGIYLFCTFSCGYPLSNKFVCECFPNLYRARVDVVQDCEQFSDMFVMLKISRNGGRRGCEMQDLRQSDFRMIKVPARAPPDNQACFSRKSRKRFGLV